MDGTLFMFLALCAGMLGAIFWFGWRSLMFITRRLGAAARGKRK